MVGRINEKFRGWLHDEHFSIQKLTGEKCRWRKTKLGDQRVQFYEHHGGYEVDGYDKRQWLYVECPKCKYEWNLNKLSCIGSVC